MIAYRRTGNVYIGAMNVAATHWIISAVLDSIGFYL